MNSSRLYCREKVEKIVEDIEKKETKIDNPGLRHYKIEPPDIFVTHGGDIIKV